jgi:diguanylate cyclase (GGDEF)-like protein/PAS domain S-box-containing protein
MVRSVFRWQAALSPLMLAAICLVLAAATSQLTRLNHGLSLLWLANAPMIAVLSARQARDWAAPLVGAVTGMMLSALCFSPLGLAASGLILASVSEAALAAALLRRWRVADELFLTTRSIPIFVAAAALVAPALSGALAAAYADRLLPGTFGSLWFDWTLGHGMGALIATPFAVLVTRESGWLAALRAAGIARASAITLMIVAVTALVFMQNTLPLLFLPIVPALIATFALKRCGAAMSVLTIAVVGGLLTIFGHGPIMLMHASQALRLQFFDFYLAVVFLVALPVAATLTEREVLNRALAESEARYRMLSDHGTDIMLTLEIDGTIRFVSAAVRDLGFFEPDALIGRNAMELVLPEDRAQVSATHIAALAAPERNHSVEYRAMKANGEINWFETNTRAVLAPNGAITAVVSIIRDLTGRKQREDELVRAATTDPLTGLLNRAAFRRAAADALSAARRGTPSALAMLDLDHFKRVNDTHGHAAGDAALLMLADLLRDNLRPQDAIGRVGGEEFAILFTGLSLNAATPIADRLRRLLQTERFATDSGPAGVTMSVGLAPLDAGRSVDAALRLADAALYAAKRKGRNRIEVAVTEMIS